MGRVRTALWLDLAVKAALVGLLAFAVARPDLPQFEGKAMLGRALTYPLAAAIVPVVWWFRRGRTRGSYPFALDALLALPFLIDVAGNAANLYDRIDWWDDANHSSTGRSWSRHSANCSCVCPSAGSTPSPSRSVSVE
jgi:hypothetical protein